MVLIDLDQSASSGHAAARGRPRDPEVERKFKQATLEALSQVGFAGLTVERICAKAGLSRTTFYRRWKSPTDALLEAFQPQDFEDPDPSAGSLLDALTAFAQLRFERWNDPVVSACMAFIQAESRLDAELRQRTYNEYIKRRASSKAYLDKALETRRVVLKVNPDILLDTIVGLSLYRISNGELMTPDDWREILTPLLD